MTRILADTRNVKQHWERRCDTLPFLEVPMSDGSVVRYYPEIPQPGLVKALEIIRNMKSQIVECEKSDRALLAQHPGPPEGEIRYRAYYSTERKTEQ
jgi:hypothetical protein